MRAGIDCIDVIGAIRAGKMDVTSGIRKMNHNRMLVASAFLCIGCVVRGGDVRVADLDKRGDGVTKSLEYTEPARRAANAAQVRVRAVRVGNAEYSWDQGVGLLVARLDEESNPAGRLEAAETLVTYAAGLAGDVRVPALVEHYAKEPDLAVKHALMMALMRTGDERCHPLMERVVQTESDEALRLFAAAGLAEWNVRTGAEGLIRLLESNKKLVTGRLAWGEAAVTLRGLNRRQGWGFPEDDLKLASDELASLPDDQRIEARRELLVRFWTDWLAVDKDRFPDKSWVAPEDETPGER